MTSTDGGSVKVPAAGITSFEGVVEGRDVPATGAINVESVVVEFKGRAGRVKALGPVDLRMDPGEFVAVVGPTGCGKTTLLNAIAGFVAPSEGRLTLDGEAVTGPGPDRGVVFQQYVLFPWRTALGNVQFALKGKGLSKKEAAERALEALRSVHLADARRRFPAELSGGMQQRVALARVLAIEPRVMLMDEPFGALDAQTRAAMQAVLLEIWESHRTTVLFITHDVDEAILLADTVYVMSAGPGVLLTQVHVPLSRPRSADDQFKEEYIQTKRDILEVLRREIEKASRGKGAAQD